MAVSVKILEEKLSGPLGELEKLASEGHEMGVYSQVIKKSLDSADHGVSRITMLRYLLVHAHYRKDQNPRQYQLWLKVLSEYGVPNNLVEWLTGHHDFGEEQQAYFESNFRESQIPVLVEVLVECSGSWYKIGLSLGLPVHVLEDILATFSGHGGIVCLSKVLKEWIVGDYVNSKPPTVESLEEALRSEIVSFGILANCLKENLAKKGMLFTPFPSSKKRRSSQHLLEITRQSRDLNITMGKSTFLEVQVTGFAANPEISFQWLKDGCQLTDDSLSYLGSNMPVLCIHKAMMSSKGIYMCEIQHGEGLPIMSDPIVLTVSVKLMVEKLIGRYTQPIHYGSTWPPVSKKPYIDLLLITHGSSLGERPDYVMEGDVDDYVKKEDNLKYKETFNAFKEGQFFLIEGRPGSGKTTLIQKLSRDWATGEAILVGAEFVFVITLRMLSNRKRAEMEDILKVFYHNESLTAEVSKYIEQTDGKGVCFLIDGLDEYGKEQNDESLVFKIIRKEILYHSMVIVASRPIAAGEWRYRADIHVEVLGFAKKQITEFVNNYPFSSPFASEKLNLYLEKHMNILHMCYLPVHTAMICFLYDVIKENIPNTETEIYRHFTMLTVLHALKRSSKDIKLSSIEDLPEDQNELFQKICELAFTMTSSSRQVFKDTEISFSTISNGDVPFLGLVTVGSSTGLYDYQDLYTFVHLTFQEYLAAFYVSKLNDDEQMRILHLYAKERHMKVVLKFYSGLVNFENKEFKFLEVINAHEDSLFHCQCAFESQQLTTCKRVVLLNESNGLSFKDQALTASDFISINFVIRSVANLFLKFEIVNCDLGVTENVSAFCSSIKLCKNLEYLNLSSNEVGVEGTEILSSCFSKTCNLQSLDFSRNEIGSEGMRALACGLKTCTKLKVLNIEGDFDAVDSECMDILGNSLKELTSLEVLNVSRHSIGNKGVIALAQAFIKCTSLTALKLDWNRIGDEGLLALVKELKHCKNLQSFDFEGNEVTNEGLKHLALSLKFWSNLRYLNLGHNEVSDESVSNLFQNLKFCKNLKVILLPFNEVTEASVNIIAECLHDLNDVEEFDFQDNKLQKGAVAVLESLKHSKNLISLNLAGNHVGYNGSNALTNSFQYWEHLEDLVLCRNMIGDDGAGKIAANLHYCSNIAKVDLASNKITSVGAKLVAEGLKVCKQIEALYLEENELSDEGAEAFASNFKHWELLKTLNLSDNKIGNMGVLTISANLKYISSSLEVLNLSFNHIDDEGAVALAYSLKVCEFLKELQLNSNRIGNEGAMTLASNLKHCRNLETFDVVENRVGGEGAQALVENVKLDTMDFSFCNIDNISIRDIANDLKECVGLLTLFLDHNQIGDEGAVTLGRSLKFCNSLSSVYLQSNNIDEEGAKGLALGLRCCDVRILHLEMNHIGDTGINSLAEGLVYCTELEQLYLEYNCISDEGSEGLAKIMQACKKIEWIELQHNLIGSEGAVLISRALKYGECLRFLPIYHNFIGDKGCAALAKQFKHCNNLQSFNFACNNIGNDGIKELAKHLKYLHNLKEMHLCDNHVSYEGAVALADGLKYCSNLELFDIGQNSIDDVGVINLAKGLKHCSNLVSVDFEDNFITDQGAIRLAKSLKHCSKLVELNLRGNCILDEGVRALAESLKQWIHLESLYVDYSKLSLDTIHILSKKLDSSEIDFSQCNMDSASCKLVMEGLTNFKKLNTLHLNKNQINEDCLAFIAPQLEKFKFLKAVYLGHNCIDDMGVKNLVSGLKCCNSVDNLELCNNLIGDEGAEAIGSLLSLSILKILELNGNRISAVGIEAMSKHLRKCTSLTLLDLSFNEIGDEGVICLVESLKNCKYLWSLALDHNYIGNGSAKALANLFQHSSYLIEVHVAHNEIGYEGIKVMSTSIHSLKLLDLSYNNLGCKGVQLLLREIKEDTHLETLHLASSIAHGETMAEVSMSRSSLKKLVMEHNRIGYKAAMALSKGLSFLHFLTSLILDHNSLNDDCATVLANGVKHCFRLKVLSLQYNRVSDCGVKPLAEALEHCYYLQELNLSSNNIGDDSAEILSYLVSVCKYLVTLDIRHNKITDKGAKLLAASGTMNFRNLLLGGNYCVFPSSLDGSVNDSSSRNLNQQELSRKLKFVRNLQILSLKSTSLNCDDNMILLCNSLKNSDFLQILCLESCEVDDKKMQLLEDGLKHCRFLKKIDLSVNHIGNDGIKALSPCLLNFGDLRELSLAGNIIGDEGVSVLGSSLKHCKKLTILDLERNRISDSGAITLCEILKNFQDLKELNLVENNIGDMALESLEDCLEHCKDLKLLLYIN